VATFTPGAGVTGNQIFTAVFAGNAVFNASTSQGVARAGAAIAPPQSPATPPSVASVIVGDGSPQRSMVRSITVTFDRLVTLQPGAFTLVSTTGVTPTVNVVTATVNNRTVATLTFGGAGVSAGSLGDGIYTLRVVASRVIDAGNPAVQMTADRTETIHRMFGDIDGDRDVDSSDYTALRLALLTSPVVTAFDVDGNGTVDAVDFRQFIARFGRRL
jgi:hypothetical protein